MLKCNWKKNENNHLQSDWYRWNPRQKNVIKSLANRINSQVTIGRKLNLPVIHRCSAAKNDHHSNKCSGEQGREHMCPIVPVLQSGHIWDSGYGGPDQLDNKNAPMIQLKLIPPSPCPMTIGSVCLIHHHIHFVCGGRRVLPSSGRRWNCVLGARG